MKVRDEQCEMPCCVIAREVVWVERIICGIIKKLDTSPIYIAPFDDSDDEHFH
jgi:hypothetical protein